MAFMDKMRSMIHKGTADAKVLGSMGVLKLQIMELESQSNRLFTKLGAEVYKSLVDRNHASVSRSTPSIRDLLKKIEGLRAQNSRMEKKYHSINGKRRAVLAAAEPA
jgi:hypothetical protein